MTDEAAVRLEMLDDDDECRDRRAAECDESAAACEGTAEKGVGEPPNEEARI